MRSIRRHLLLSLIGGATVLLGLASVAFYWYARSFLTGEFDAASRSKALTLVTLTEKRQSHVELNFADEFMPEYERAERPEYFQLWLANGALLERSRSLQGQDLPRRTGDLIAALFWDLPLPDGRAGRAVGLAFVPQIYDGGTIDLQQREALAKTAGKVLLVVARERTELDHTLAALRLALALGGVLFLLATGATVSWAVRRGLSPLAALGERASTIGAASLETRFPTDEMPTELRPISQRLNDLLARLQEAFQRERRISADIAHELRTPLAELRSRVEVAIKWPEDSTGNASTLGHVLAIGQKMETMVASLLAVARSEEGKLAIQPEEIALAALAAELWAPLAAEAQSKQLDFAADLPRDLRVHSDPALFRHILGNLLGNAVEHTPPGGRIRLHGTASQGQFELSVVNSADNLCAEDLPLLFERFWRKDPARTGAGHVGLGLTLARAIATALGLSLTADLPAPDTLRVTLRGPETFSRASG